MAAKVADKTSVGCLFSWETRSEASDLTAFRWAVYAVTSLIPKGHIATYKTVATLLDCGSTQAVGTALKVNPFCPVVPCHRIVSSGDRRKNVTIGGFSGATQDSGHENITRKIKLLREEGVHFDPVTLSMPADSKCIMRPSDFPVEILNKIREKLGLSAFANSTSDTKLAAAGEKAGHSMAAGGVKDVSGQKRKRGAAQSGGSGALTAGGKVAAEVASSSGSHVDGLRTILGREGATGEAVRLACRTGELQGHTSGLAPGYAQANLVILPKEYAFHFLLFCIRNPKPCPLIEVTDVGSWEAKACAPGSDIRRDLPQYRVFRHGKLDETCNDITHLWPGEDTHSSHPDARKDWVAFLLGCSFSFEEALLDGGVPVRHLQQEKSGKIVETPKGYGMAEDPKNVPMYNTCVPTTPAGPFNGPLVCSMRPMLPAEAKRASDITERFPRVHGKPVYTGEPSRIGVSDISTPDYGDSVTIKEGEVPVFWACGVTPQAALLQAKVPIAITHAPGHMFVCDKLNSELAGFSELDVTPYLRGMPPSKKARGAK